MNGSTKLVGILGNPITHTKSPAMHEAAFKALSLNFTYVPLWVQDSRLLKEAVLGLKALSFHGANITLPYKEAVLPYLTNVSKEAHQIGAVNTLVVKEDEIMGYNTDAPGFIADLAEQGFSVANLKQAVILGAGGSAKAVLYGLLHSGCLKIKIMSRTPSKAEELMQHMKAYFPKATLEVQPWTFAAFLKAQEAELFINCTPVGMNELDKQMPWDEKVPFFPHQTAYDLIYHPNPTPWLKHASQGGARPLSGLGTLVHQGALSFEMWTGVYPPLQAMRQALKGNL